MTIPKNIPRLTEDHLDYESWKDNPIFDRAEVDHALGTTSLEFVVGVDITNLYCCDEVRLKGGELYVASEEPETFLLKNIKSYRSLGLRGQTHYLEQLKKAMDAYGFLVRAHDTYIHASGYPDSSLANQERIYHAALEYFRKEAPADLVGLVQGDIDRMEREIQVIGKALKDEGASGE